MVHVDDPDAVGDVRAVIGRRASGAGSAVVFEGWANEADIEIYYDHNRLNLSLASVKRPGDPDPPAQRGQQTALAGLRTASLDEVLCTSSLAL